MATKKRNAKVKMKKNAPKGWIPASAVKIIRRGGKKVLLVRK